MNTVVFQIRVLVNPIALRKAKIVCNFGLFECNRVKALKIFYLCVSGGGEGDLTCHAYFCDKNGKIIILGIH